MTGRPLREGEAYLPLEIFLPNARQGRLQGFEKMISVGNALTASLPEWMRSVTSQQDVSQVRAIIPQSDTELRRLFKEGFRDVSNSVPSDDPEMDDWVNLGIYSRLRQRPMTIPIEELADGPVPTSTQDSSREQTILHLQYSLIQAYKSLQTGHGFSKSLTQVKEASDNMERHWATPTSHDQVPYEEADEADPTSIPSTAT